MNPTVKNYGNFESESILGVRVDKVEKVRVFDILKNLLKEDKKFFLTTVNPEFIIEALKNKKFKKILNFSDLNFIDGIGIIWAIKFIKLQVKDYKYLSRTKRARRRKFIIYWQAFYTLLAVIFYPRFLKRNIADKITGVFLIEKLAQVSQGNRHSIFILGGRQGVADRAKHELEKKFPATLISSTMTGFLNQNQSDKNWIKAINDSGADILIVALGSPKQEKWIFNNYDKLKNVRIAVGVGGAIDFIAKSKRRAPLWVRKLGLEWLFRLIIEPRRFPRIRKATYYFIKKVIGEKIKHYYI
ncbi:MAG: WecB/TagA/CpsF family glycosyltransferase [Candidatus Moranbacteria bacterium]|nr:WecB/TagA/CpsF family glycosyltransferase [Candidatus Moranbacteria bacterium]